MDESTKRSPFKLVITTFPMGRGLESEIQLLKSAALYGDQVQLLSPNFIMARMLFGGRGESSLDDALNTIKRVIFFSNEEPKNTILLSDQLDALNQAHSHGLIEDFVLPPWCIQILKDFDPLDFETFTPLEIREDMSPREKALIRRKISINLLAELSVGCTEKMKDIVAHEQVYPLFDIMVGASLDNEEKVLHSQRIPHIDEKHPALATDLFERLPTFSEASIDEIVDIRKELERPLVRFRGALLGFASDIKAEPWNQDFRHEAELLVRRVIEPAVLDIEDQVKGNTYLRQLAYKATKEPLQVVGASALGLAVGALSTLPGPVMGALTGVIGGGLVALDTHREWSQKKGEIEGNQMYFYYAVRQRMHELGKKRAKRTRGPDRLT